MLDLSKLKALADDKLNVAKIIISFCDWIRKHCWKRRKCWLPAFSPFPTMFLKAFQSRFVKNWDCLIKNQLLTTQSLFSTTLNEKPFEKRFGKRRASW